jgi:hypothetical protein
MINPARINTGPSLSLTVKWRAGTPVYDVSRLLAAGSPLASEDIKPWLR